MIDQDIILRLRRAFPAVMESDVDTVLANVPPGDVPPSPHDVGFIVIGGEQLQIPFRIYYAEPESIRVEKLNERQKLVLSALYSRHINGHVREKHARLIVASGDTWIPPFVIQLLGEYVLEIIELLETHSAQFSGKAYLEFAEENRKFLELTRQRAVSYWDCYYRSEFPRFQDYPGYQLVRSLEMSGRPSTDVDPSPDQETSCK
jgi:hypothetical protein